MVTIKDPRYKRQITKIVLEDVLVLATWTQIENGGKGEKGGETSPVDVYTLEVSPEEGEKLALAATEGRLQFALRNATDVKTVLTTGATIPKTLASFRPPVKRRRVSSRGGSKKQEAEALSFTVQIIKGGEVSKVKIKADGGL